MHRREVLKGLAALPLAGILAGCDDDKHDRRIVEVHLDGAFAVVIQEHKENSIVAFSPRPKTGEEHEFHFNGALRPESTSKNLHFNLALGGQDREQKPRIDPGLEDFHFTTDNWRIGDSLVTLELPAPTEITFSGHRSPVTFQSGNRKGFLPSNHILKYELHREAQPKLECSALSNPCQAEDSYDGVTRFFFEVGPTRYLKHEESLGHAIAYFNYVLQQSFRDQAEKFSLVNPYEGGVKDNKNKAQVMMPPRFMPAVLQYGTQPATLENASYLVDCEYGLPTGSTRTAPNP